MVETLRILLWSAVVGYLCLHLVAFIGGWYLDWLEWRQGKAEE